MGRLSETPLGPTTGELLRVPPAECDGSSAIEGGDGGADRDAGSTSVDETAREADITAPDSSTLDRTLDQGDGAQPSRGPVPHGGSAAGHQLGTVVASWVSDLRRHAAAVGKPSAAAEEYISQLESTTANIAEIYTEWVNHCEGNEVDPVHARTDAILGCVDTFATSLARAGRSHSHFNGRMRIISNIYKLVRGVDVNTKTVKDTRKRLKQSHTAGPKRTNASFNSGKVFHALAEYQREPGFPETDQELFYRRAFTFAGRTDFCARADDFSHLKLRRECIDPRDKYGRELPLTPAGVRNCQTLSLAYLGTKTTGTALSSSSTARRARKRFTPQAELKDTASMLASYIELTQPKRAHMHEHERDSLLVGSTKCNRKEWYTRKNKVTEQLEKKFTECGGHCGQYHPLTSDTIAKDTVWCLKLAQVDTKEFTSHKSRGNAETIIVHAAKYSDQFDVDEARKRARHSEMTMRQYYLREPDKMFMAKLNDVRATMRRNMYAEEYLRLW